MSSSERAGPPRLLQAADERRQASGLLGSPYFHPTGGDGLDDDSVAGPEPKLVEQFPS